MPFMLFALDDNTTPLIHSATPQGGVLTAWNTVEEPTLSAVAGADDPALGYCGSLALVTSNAGIVYSTRSSSSDSWQPTISLVAGDNPEILEINQDTFELIYDVGSAAQWTTCEILY